MSGLSTAPNPPSLYAIHTTYIALPVFATFTLFLRVGYRLKRHQFWWDDGAAIVACIFLLTLMGVGLAFQSPSYVVSLAPAARVSLYYAVGEIYYCAVWSARIALMVTIVRLRPAGRLRTLVWFLIGGFMVAWIVVMAQVLWHCESDPSWKQNLPPQCDLGRQVAIAQIITSVLMDLCLIFIPIKMIWRARLPRADKIRIISVFAATCIFTAISLYHSFTVFKYSGLTEALAAMIEASIGVVVNNLAVVVALVSNLLAKNEEDETEHHEMPRMRPIVRKHPLLQTITVTRGIVTHVDTDTGTMQLSNTDSGTRVGGNTQDGSKSMTTLHEGKQEAGDGLRDFKTNTIGHAV